MEVKLFGPCHDQAVAPLELSLSVTVPPTQIGLVFVAPEEDGIAFMVTGLVAAVPQPSEYVSVNVPEPTPVTVPVSEPTEPTVVLLLLQVP